MIMTAQNAQSETSQDALDERMERLQRRLPASLGKAVTWVRGPSSKAVRLPLGVALVAGGTVGFLPIVGFWMLPVGLVMIARDVPPLRPPLVRFFDWFEAKLPAQKPDNRN
jgi:hypothetical protein